MLSRLLTRPLPALLPAGKFYTLLTGSNEKRWGKMKDKVGAARSWAWGHHHAAAMAGNRA